MSTPHDLDSQELEATASFVGSEALSVDESCRSIRCDETLTGVTAFGVGELNSEGPKSGVTLADWLPRFRDGLPWRQTVDLLIAVAEQLAPIHARGDCHGTICPKVIRMTPGDHQTPDVWTLDVSNMARSSTASVPNSARSCQAPEQIRSRSSVLPQSDVYAVGVVLYWMLCNRYPFRAGDQDDLHREILKDTPQPPRQLAHGVPLELERLCLRLLAKETSARPANGEELARELRQVIAQTETLELSAELSINSATSRKAAAVSREADLLLVLTWESSSETPRWQHALRTAIERRQGCVLSQSELVTIARLTPIDGLAAGMPTLLTHSLELLAELTLEDSELGFTVDSAESESLRHRAPRLSGRVSERGLELTLPSLDVVRRWLPCRAVQ